jgi:hypothetical protein
MGSSRFRAETIDGFRYMLEKMIHWDGDRAFAHDECTLCTSRLLYILAQGRRLFTDADLKTISGHSHSLNESIAGLLHYFLSREPEALSWWGLGTRFPGQMIVDVQYLAWSARGVSLCLAVDRELRKRGTHWLDECGIPLSSVERLLQQRWRQLFGIRDEDFVGDREELTHELALGNIGLACLDLDALDPEIRALALDGLDLSHAFWPNLRKAWTKLERRSSLVSSLHLMPATLALDGAFPDLTPETTPMLVELYLRCAASPAWVTTGADVGEWGFDSKATQPILDSLIAFWRYAFRPENRSRFEAAFEERLNTRHGGSHGAI